jgi:hypothetical protein
MSFECFATKHQQALLLIMFFTLSFAGVEPHRGDYRVFFLRFFLLFFRSSLISACYPLRNRLDGAGKHQKASRNSLSTYNAFETLNNTKVTAQIGGTAILPCIVDASSPATVTWIRRSDYRLLTGPYIVCRR